MDEREQTGTDHDGAAQNDAVPENTGTADAPTGGSETTEEQLQADNAVEEDMIRAVEPDAQSS